MITVTATQLQAALFEYLDKVAEGEIIIIQHQDKQVARLEPLEARATDWRDQMTQSVKILVAPDELMAPLEEFMVDTR